MMIGRWRMDSGSNVSGWEARTRGEGGEASRPFALEPASLGHQGWAPRLEGASSNGEFPNLRNTEEYSPRRMALRCGRRRPLLLRTAWHERGRSGIGRSGLCPYTAGGAGHTPSQRE